MTAAEATILRDHGWAVEIIRKQFSKGLTEICSPKFLDARYRQFQSKDDPIYAELLRGMDNEGLSKTFVSYWTIAQTLATQSRFWLEDAIAQIILHQVREKKREAEMVFSAPMLSAGYLASRKPVAVLGANELEHCSSRSPWRVAMNVAALQEVDLRIGEQERETRPKRKAFQPRQWSSAEDQKAKATDQRLLGGIAAAFKGSEATEVNIQCNLLIVDPNKAADTPSVHGFRFVNPKTLSNHAARKQERVNLLRLYGYLVQEKIYEEPHTIRVCAAELLPRYGDFDQSDRHPDYFSSDTYWTSERLWEFIGVPFEVVTLAIRAVSAEFREQLLSGLQSLLPGQSAESLFGDGGTKRRSAK